MTKLIIDATKDKIFLMIIVIIIFITLLMKIVKLIMRKLMILINEFLDKKYSLKKIQKIYVNRGPGSFAGIRNSLSVVKALI